jgi:hypothetical protein
LSNKKDTDAQASFLCWWVGWHAFSHHCITYFTFPQEMMHLSGLTSLLSRESITEIVLVLKLGLISHFQHVWTEKWLWCVIVGAGSSGKGNLQMIKKLRILY